MFNYTIINDCGRVQHHFKKVHYCIQTNPAESRNVYIEGGQDRVTHNSNCVSDIDAWILYSHTELHFVFSSAVFLLFSSCLR